MFQKTAAKRPNDSVDAGYVYNHIFQVITWVNYLASQNPKKEAEYTKARELLKEVQKLIEKAEDQ